MTVDTAGANFHRYQMTLLGFHSIPEITSVALVLGQTVEDSVNNNNNNNKQTFQNAKFTLKSRTGACGGYNQKHANH